MKRLMIMLLCSTLLVGFTPDTDFEEVVHDYSYFFLFNCMDDDTRMDIRANNYSTPDTPIVYCRVANKVILDNVEISPEDHTLIFEKIDAYEPTIQKDMYDYRPHTPEYPDMEVLFNVETHRTRSEYAYDGALCKPDGYDEFFSEIEDILEPYIPEN